MWVYRVENVALHGKRAFFVVGTLQAPVNAHHVPFRFLEAQQRSSNSKKQAAASSRGGERS